MRWTKTDAGVHQAEVDGEMPSYRGRYRFINTGNYSGLDWRGELLRSFVQRSGYRVRSRPLAARLAIVAVITNLSVVASVDAAEIATGIDASEHASDGSTNQVEYKAFYNEIEATEFVHITRDRVFFTVPFPASSEPFTLRIIKRQNEELLLDADYQMVDGEVLSLGDNSDNEIVDESSAIVAESSAEPANTGNLEFERGGQLDVTALGSAEDGSDFDRRETEQEGESDLLASFSVGAAYQAVDASLAVEAVHRSNPDNALRFGGPGADVSRFHSTLQFNANDGSTFYLNAGDISVASSNSLVNSGMSSRGFSIGFIAPDERFRWEVGRVYGQDIVGLIRGPIAVSSESYRIGASVGFKLVENDVLEWDAHLSNLRVKRDVEDGFATGESISGETNSVWGIGSDFSLLDDRLKLSFSWARSDYDNPTDLNDENLPDDEGFEIFSPGITSGNAYRHTLEWDAWSNEDESSYVSLAFSTERADPFYRSIHGEATADRRQWSLLADVTVGPVTASIGTTQYQNNLGGLISVHTLDEAVHTAEVTLDVVSLQDSEGNNIPLSPVIPSSVSIFATVEELQTLNGDQIILAPVIEGFDFMDQVTETLGVSMDWEGESSTTSLGIDYSFLDNSQRERATADSRDLVYSVSHSLEGENWNLAGRVALSVSDDLDNASRSTTDLVEWGFSGSYIADNGLVLSAGFDNSLNRYNDRILDEDEDSESQVYSFTLEFGTWMARKLAWSVEPSASASWQRTVTDNRSIFYVNDQLSESFTLNVGVPF